MKGNRRITRTARQLFRLCKVDGRVDDEHFEELPENTGVA